MKQTEEQSAAMTSELAEATSALAHQRDLERELRKDLSRALHRLEREREARRRDEIQAAE